MLKRLLIALICILPTVAFAQIPSVQDTTLRSPSTAYTPQARYSYYGGKVVKQEFINGKWYFFPTMQYLKQYFASSDFNTKWDSVKYSSTQIFGDWEFRNIATSFYGAFNSYSTTASSRFYGPLRSKTLVVDQGITASDISANNNISLQGTFSYPSPPSYIESSPTGSGVLVKIPNGQIAIKPLSTFTSNSDVANHVYAANGLSKSDSTIVLGGSLIGNTTIDGGGLFNLLFTNLNNFFVTSKRNIFRSTTSGGTIYSTGTSADYFGSTPIAALQKTLPSGDRQEMGIDSLGIYVRDSTSANRGLVGTHYYANKSQNTYAQMADITAATSGSVPSTRTLNNGFGIQPIGDLSANRTISADTTVLQTTSSLQQKAILNQGTYQSGAAYSILNGQIRNQLTVNPVTSGYTGFSGTQAGLRIVSLNMSTTAKYTPMVMFGTTDPDKVTQNPFMGAGIGGYVTQTISSDIATGFGLSLWTSAQNGGATYTPVETVTITPTLFTMKGNIAAQTALGTAGTDSLVVKNSGQLRAVSPAFYVPTTRTVSTTTPVTGGGNLGSNLTIGLGGLTGYGTANQMLGMNVAATGYEYKTYNTANGVTITDAAGSKTWGLGNITPTTVKTATEQLTTVASGVAGTDSILVKDAATNTIKKISATFYQISQASIPVTGTTQQLAVNRVYIPHNTGVTTFTLPTTANEGDLITIIGECGGVGTFNVAQNAGQYIRSVSGSTTTGAAGYIQGTSPDNTITLRCTLSSNTKWTISTQQGTFNRF